MFINVMMFWLMCVEGAICVFLCIPFMKHSTQATVNFLASNVITPTSHLTMVGNGILALVGVMFLANLQTTYNHHMSDEVMTDGFRIRLLAAQRDMYISGICLFLNAMLQMLYSSMVTNIKLEKSLGALEKQAKSASSSYTKLLEEHDVLQKQLKKLVGLDAGDANTLEKLLKENATLETEVAALKKSVAASDASIAQVKKQADSQSAAYMKLLDESTAKGDKEAEVKELHQQVLEQKKTINDLTKDRDSLKAQIQDYDFMFADAKKKAE
ncbi:Aste57867_14248 [Aphanomyces stellatus]|uniref:Endoplasmic reticulum transmembrane protein n=1 Tax=Aphanomyces stellatus TaxID=120398 RepID=A0A485L0R8_9STRA|nr:hypothetical protein As57867_014197 [Aphanomyces stellatus]VFT91073.1 Aste57867_14248 [Aphanomyces stellatus]